MPTTVFDNNIVPHSWVLWAKWHHLSTLRIVQEKEVHIGHRGGKVQTLLGLPETKMLDLHENLVIVKFPWTQEKSCDQHLNYMFHRSTNWKLDIFECLFPFGTLSSLPPTLSYFLVSSLTSCWNESFAFQVLWATYCTLEYSFPKTRFCYKQNFIWNTEI